MKTIYLILLLAFSSVSFAQQSIKSTVYFDVDKHQLRTESKHELDLLVNDIKYYRIHEIRLTAHTDHDASETYNIALSKRRANEVLAYLEGNGIPIRNVKTSSHGEYRPAASNATEEGKQLNRRVEIHITYSLYKSAEEVLNDLKEDVQYFNLIDEDRTIKGKEGIEVDIPKDAFMDSEGNPIPNHLVQIELEEFTTPGESFINQLTTESHGEMLTTGGMLRIDAMYNGKKLEMRPGKAVTYRIPNEETENGMTVFTGEQLDNGTTTWNYTSTSFNQPQSLDGGVPIELDTNAFNKYFNSDLEYTINYYTYIPINWPVKPYEPIKPRAPYVPRKPDPETVLNGIGNLLSSDKRKERIADEKYQELLERYNQRLAEYNRRMSLYEQNMEEFNRLNAIYTKEAQEVRKKLNTHLEFLTNKYNSIKKVYDQKRLNLSIIQLKKASQNGSLRTYNPEIFLSGFANIRLQDDLKFKLDELRKALNLYTFLVNNSIEDVRLKFLYHDRFLPHKLAKYGYSEQLYTQKVVDIRFNKLYRDMMATSEIQDMIKAAVETKMSKDNPSNASFGFFQATTSNLGWINCDRFSNVDRSRMVSVTLSSVIAARMMLYIKKFKSLLNANYETASIPRNTQAKAIFMAVEDGKPKICIKEFVSKEDHNPVRAEYKLVTLSEAKEMLANL